MCRSNRFQIYDAAKAATRRKSMGVSMVVAELDMHAYDYLFCEGETEVEALRELWFACVEVYGRPFRGAQTTADEAFSAPTLRYGDGKTRVASWLEAAMLPKLANAGATAACQLRDGSTLESGRYERPSHAARELLILLKRNYPTESEADLAATFPMTVWGRDGYSRSNWANVKWSTDELGGLVFNIDRWLGGQPLLASPSGDGAPEAPAGGAGKPEDPVEPNHYGGSDDPYEAIKVIEAWADRFPAGTAFHLGNTIKYVARAGHKANQPVLVDLRKALWYLERAIQVVERAEP